MGDERVSFTLALAKSVKRIDLLTLMKCMVPMTIQLTNKCEYKVVFTSMYVAVYGNSKAFLFFTLISSQVAETK